MSERSERPPRDIAKAAQWTVEKIAERFEQMPFPAHDIAYGAGEQIGAPPAGWDWDSYLLHRAEFYPDAGVVRVTTPDVRIELFRATPPTLREDGVLVENESGTSRVLFQRDGHVAVEVISPAYPRAPEAPESPSAAEEQPTGHPSPTEPPQARPAPPKSPSRGSSEPPHSADHIA